MWLLVQEYFSLIGKNVLTYFAVGPLFIDRGLQWFIRSYQQWASAHGPWRQRLVWTVAICGMVWVQFWAFETEYKIRLAEENQANGGFQARDKIIDGLFKDRSDLRSQLDAKDKELQAVKASKVQTKYVQVPPAPLTVHVDAAGAYIQPHLSEQEKTKLHEVLQPLLGDFGKKPLIIYASNYERSGIYATEFMRVLKAAGVNALGPGLAGAIKEDDRGVLVGLRDPEHPSELSKRFIAALKLAGIDAKTTRWGDPDQPAPALQPDQIDFDLFVVE